MSTIDSTAIPETPSPQTASDIAAKLTPVRSLLTPEEIIQQMIPKEDARRSKFLGDKHIKLALEALIEHSPDDAKKNAVELFHILSDYAKTSLGQEQERGELDAVVKSLRAAARRLVRCSVPSAVDGIYGGSLLSHLASIADALEKNVPDDPLGALGLSRENIGKRGGGGKAGSKLRGLQIRELHKLLPPTIRRRYALIANLLELGQGGSHNVRSVIAGTKPE